MKRTLLIGLFMATGICYLSAQGEHYIYPEDAGIINVTKAPYNADSTGQSDATAAIQAALDDYPNGRRVIYLPKGTYLVSNTLKWPEGDGSGTAWKRTILHGEGRDYTTIKLKDNCEGYQNPQSRKAVIWTGKKPAQRFRNAIYDLTVNTGAGNPGAAGIQFNCSNEGTMQRVRIKSGDGQGVYGLDLAFENEIGPGYISDLIVEGFDVGIMHGYAINSMTFEKITLRNQNQAGFKNSGNVSMISGLTSENNVTAVENGSGSSCMVLLDAYLSSTGDSLPAIVNGGTLYGRNLNRTGYAVTVESTHEIPITLDDEHIREFMSHAPLRLFPSPVTMLNLPVKEVPHIPWSEPSEWVNPVDFGAVGDGNADDTKAIQDAIDAGKETVYLPGGLKFKTSDTLFIRGDVIRIIGCEGVLSGNGTIVFDEGTHDTVILERVDMIYSGVSVINRSGRTVIFSSSTMGSPDINAGIDSYGTGNFFLNNIVTQHIYFHQPGQQIWCRHINTENLDTVNVWNMGGRLWLLGHKTERGRIKLKTTGGGETELLGAHNYSTHYPKVFPWFLVENSKLSIAGARETNYNQAQYEDYVMEIRGADTLVLKRLECPEGGAGAGRVIPVFCGYASGLPSPPAVQNLRVEDTVTSYYLTWEEGDPGNLDFYNLYLAEYSGGPYTKQSNFLINNEFIYHPSGPGDHYFMVTQVDTNGIESEASNEVMVSVPDYPAPAVPGGLTADYQNGIVTLNWEANTEYYLGSYKVYRAPDPPVIWIEKANISPVITSYHDPGPVAGAINHYAVSALTIFNKESAKSEMVTVDLTLGIGPVSGPPGGNARVYPNPAGERLNIELSSTGRIRFELYSIMGQLIHEGDLDGGRALLDLSACPAGIYLLKLKQSTGASVHKIRVIK